MSLVHRIRISIRLESLRRILGFRFALVAILVISALVIAISSGAQGLLIGKGERRVKEVPATKSVRPDNFDIRVANRKDVEALVRNRHRNFGMSEVVNAAVDQQRLIEPALAELKSRRSDLEVKGSPLTGAVELLDSQKGLTDPAPRRSGIEIVRDFLAEQKAVYGLSDGDVASLNFLGESDSPSGIRMVRVEQMINGRPVFGSESRFILTKDGRIVRSLGMMVPDASIAAAPLDSLLSPDEALRRTMSQLGVELEGSRMRVNKKDGDDLRVEIAANSASIGGKVNSKIVYFPVAPGVLIPAWSQTIFSTDRDWYVLVDAVDGTMLWRKNIRSHQSTQDARFRVYVQADGTTPADSPAPLSPSNATPGSNTQPPGIAPTIVSMFTAQSIVASPNGWINDCPGGVCTANETQTVGNNVLACMDRTAPNNTCDTDAASVLDGNGRPTGNPDVNSRDRDFLGTTPRDFQTNYLPPPQGGNPEAGQTPTGAGNNGTLAVDQFRRGMITQLFYVSNWYHDRMFLLGFNEAAANFQQTNFSGMGLGNDRVLADGQDVSSTDNANFATPPDGQSGRAQMFRFIGPTVDRDGSLDTEILIHELTHGTSNRIIGNASGLNWDPGRGMGEGWSDFYSLALLNNTAADDPNGQYAEGGYALYKAFGVTTFTDNYLYGIRRFPYSTNNTVNPLTWADVDDWTNNLSGGIAPDPLGFNIGGAQEVHNSGEVWCLSLWEMRSRIIAANAGSVPTGNQASLQLVTDAMKLTPVIPTYTDARDALLAADCAANAACPNEESIWGGFADRGLGYGARVSSAYGFAPVATHQGIVESFSNPYLDVVNVAVSDPNGNNNGVIDQGEVVRLTVTLRNPWRSPGKSIAGATATLTSGTAGVAIQDGNSTYGPIAAQGTAAGDTFQIVSPLASCGNRLNFTITTTSTLGVRAVDFSLRVGAPSGTQAPITYTRTPGTPLAIQDNRPRGVIDSLTITDDFEIADLNFRVNSIPHTFPGDLTVGIKAPNGYGVDLVTFIGGAVAGGGDGDNITNMVIDNQAVGDILLATNAQAPYTGSWLPIANSPSWPVLGFGPQEPIGELNKLNGASTFGTWQILVSDQAQVDTGTLNSWSLIVTPRAFVCVAVPTAAGVTVGGRVLSQEGRGIRNALVTLTDSEGGVRQVMTGRNGNFLFEEVEAGQTYVIAVSSRRYTFDPRVLEITDNVTDLELVAQ